MAMNLDRFKKDLEALCNQGASLEFAMRRDIATPSEFDPPLRERLGKEKADALIKNLPDFNVSYEEWYSESLALLRQLLPERVENFVSFYEKPKTRKEIAYGNYVIQDYLQGLRVTFAGDVKVDTAAAFPQF
jgi:hypothetical protein